MSEISRKEGDENDLTTHSYRHFPFDAKTNEVILKERRADAKYRLVGRTPVTITEEVGPAIYYATKQLALGWKANLENRYFVGHNPDGSPYPIDLLYGASATVDELDDMFNRWAFGGTGHAFLTVAGDDNTFALPIVDGMCCLFAGDLSGCDGTMREGALKFQYAVHSIQDVDQDVIMKLWNLARAPRMFGNRNGKFEPIFVWSEPERITGGVDTSVGNSIPLAEVILRAMRNGRISYTTTSEEITALMLEAGFVMKYVEIIRCHIDELYLYAPSFLKMRPFLTTEGRFTWCPLSSRLLKASKTLKDPRLRSKAGGYRKPNEPKISYPVAASRALNAYACGLSGYTCPPLLASFVTKFLVDASASSNLPTHWVVPGAKHILDTDAAIASIAKWYDVEVDVVQDFALHIDHEVSVLKACTHSFWWAMARRDYF
jgi:hypothetical protein